MVRNRPCLLRSVIVLIHFLTWIAVIEFYLESRSDIGSESDSEFETESEFDFDSEINTEKSKLKWITIRATTILNVLLYTLVQFITMQ